MSHRSRRCPHLEQSRIGSNDSQNRVVCLRCHNVLFEHYFRECDETLIQLADRSGRPLSGQALARNARSTRQETPPPHQQASPEPMERIVEVPVTKVVRVPAEIRVVREETPVEVPVIQTLEKVVEVPVEKYVEVPKIVTKVVRRWSAWPPLTAGGPGIETAEAQTQTDWTMAQEVVVLEDSEGESYTYATVCGQAASSAGRS